MPQYMVLQADPLPKVGGDGENYAVYRVNAATPAEAVVEVATQRKDLGPTVLHVVPALSVTKYTMMPMITYTAVPG